MDVTNAINMRHMGKELHSLLEIKYKCAGGKRTIKDPPLKIP